MSTMTSKELKAINWYREENNLKLKLSAYPIIYFQSTTGEVSINILNLIGQYEHHIEEFKKERARQRRADKQREQQMQRRIV